MNQKAVAALAEAAVNPSKLKSVALELVNSEQNDRWSNRN
jgi:hypothetical protein